MSLFTEQRLRDRVYSHINKSPIGSYYDSTNVKARLLLEKTINEQRSFSAQSKQYDIFLSHSSSDAELVEGLKLEIEDLGFTVYIDWIEDPQLDRSKVDKNTASLLKSRMQNCSVLIYAFSENAINSKWMPWELGYFDGLKGKVAILPISNNRKDEFHGSEYLGLYYYIQIDTMKNTNNYALWIHESFNSYVRYDLWINGSFPYTRNNIL